jgi:hypothetical protein
VKFSDVKFQRIPLCSSQFVVWGQTDRVMQICTCLPLHCESRKMNAESRKKQDQKKLVFFAALQHTHNNVQKSTNKVTEMKKM